MEKRFGFVRAENPFEGIYDYLEADELRISSRQIEYPLQLSLDGLEGSLLKYGLRVRLGYYFELLTQGIYGGVLKGSRQLSNNHHESDKPFNNNILASELDVVFFEKSCLRESKAVSPGESLEIRDEQLAKYACLQLGNYFENPPKIIFEVFRHGVRRLVKNYKDKSLEDIVNALSSSTRFMLSLPFSFIVAVHEKSKDHSFEHASRYEGEKWEHHSKFFSSGLNAMLAYPEKTLSGFGLDIGNYNILKLRFPRGITMNKKEIRPFPVLLVRDKDHGKWVESFRERGHELYPNLFRLKSRIE